MNRLKLLNVDHTDIRHFKTVFDIVSPDAVMDFGLWLLTRCEHRLSSTCTKMDILIEFLYDLMRQGIRNKETLNVTVEESFEEIFITMRFEHPIELHPRTRPMIDMLGERCAIRENMAGIRFPIHNPELPQIPSIERKQPAPSPSIAPQTPIDEPETAKEFKVLETKDKEILRQSFVHKTSAVDYVRDIGGDVLDEIRDLESLDEEWREKLQIFEGDPTEQALRDFADGVLGVYVRAINNLFEFTSLAYALSTLGSFLKEHATGVIHDPKKVKTLVMMLEHLGSDLTSWRDHIFALQDTADIHYLDSSFFSSCVQIEGIITDKEVETDDDNDIEFF